MHIGTVRTVGLLAAAGVVILLLQGCASLQPLPRFNSKSPAPASQLSNPALLVNNTTISEMVPDYSRLREHAERKESGTREAPQRTPSASAAPRLEIATSRDEIGIATEEEDEVADGTDATKDEESAEEPTAEDEAVAKVIRGAMQSKKGPATEEENHAINRESLMLEIVNMLGTRYRFGGTNALDGIDCSAFTGTIYSRAIGYRLPRTSNAQFGIGKKIRKDDLLVGDLVFFKTRRRKHAPVSHVGIYVGEDLFAHASRKRGVIISPLDSPYYTKTYVGARRLVNDELTSLKESPPALKSTSGSHE